MGQARRSETLSRWPRYVAPCSRMATSGPTRSWSPALRPAPATPSRPRARLGLSASRPLSHKGSCRPTPCFVCLMGMWTLHSKTRFWASPFNCARDKQGAGHAWAALALLGTAELLRTHYARGRARRSSTRRMKPHPYGTQGVDSAGARRRILLGEKWGREARPTCKRCAHR